MTDPDRTRPPEVGPAPAVGLPPVRRRTLPGGMGLVTLPRQGVPLVVLEIVVDAGSARDPSDRTGLADLTASLFAEGAAGMDRLDVARRLAGIGGRLSAGAGHDAARIRVTALASSVRPALELLADLVRRPEFPDDAVARLRREREIALVQQSDQPGSVAGRAFSRELYGPGHPYGLPSDGTLESVPRLERDDFARFYEETYRPGASTLVAVGEMDDRELRRMVEDAFGDWEPGEVDAIDVAPPPSPGRGIVLLDRPDSAQSEIRVGHVGLARSDPDYFATAVLNYVLGGSFHSRLNLNLREDKGWTYGVRTVFRYRRGPGPFVVAVPVDTEVTRSALEEIRRELDRIVEGPVEENERSLAVNGMTLSLPRMFETPGAVADRVRELVVHDLPDDWWETVTERFRAVTAADVERAARDHLHPDRLLHVVVGDGSKVAAELESLGELRAQPWKPPSRDADRPASVPGPNPSGPVGG